ncbi:alpha-hydroxy-acid oxidizing protein [Noviherbaspirillum cavernae]|uniref:Alpha-hydroxy-acid oxidizing protein n=1 Tax=Noviherbaspirillum cavernae TaxID=2320862 RepID=A0A418X2E7_9BURK|nr:alpha-hydroxy acid oxidase [Noviherbaspirillum cavernae]RJG06628.1 alpha-hydroxy-acid oxidizing protein [Noviherbaspirillum cavernae]
MNHIPAVQPIPSGIVTLADHELHARSVLDDNAWAYFSGGAADEITLRANRSAWDEMQLSPRVLRNLVGGNTRTQLLGRTLAHPILLAPVAFQRMAHPDGEVATAYAAAMQGAGLVLSTQASMPLEDVAQAVLSEAQRGPLWFQFYFQHDRGFMRELIQRAEQAGYEAIVVTVDAPSSGVRDRERRAEFKLPPGISAVNLAGLPPAPPVYLAPHQSRMFDALLATAPTWSDIEWLQGVTRLPILLKGVMHEDDARLASQMGLGGIIVSNHGGRTLDTMPATAAVFPRIHEVVGGALPILLDGGIRRGTDVLKAIALGASAVLIGRPYVWGLANAGAMGVSHVLRLLRDELEIAMALCGCATLDEVSSATLFKR